MVLAVAVTAALVGCKGRETKASETTNAPKGEARGDEPSAPPTNTATGGTSSIKECQALARALDAGDRCGVSDERLASLRGQLASTANLDERARANEARWCSLMLGERVDDLKRRECAFTLSADELALVDAARARRTAIPEGASEAERALLGRMVDFRDDVCACTSTDCTRAIADGFSPPSLDGLGAAAREAGAAMLDEAGVCHRAVERAIAHR
jgi:hypothetical protein